MKIKIVRNAKGGFDLVVGDKVIGHHETEDLAKEAVEALEGGDDDGDATLNAKINAALSAREKRFNENLAKTLPEAIKAVLSPTLEEFKKTLPSTTPDDPNKGKDPAKQDPELIKLRERFEASEKSLLEERAKRTAGEERARKEAARGELITALDAKGVKGARAKALVSHMEATGAVRFTDEGKPELVVKRARSKGAAAEDLAFDLAAGIDDWSKTDDAKEWLPAPGGVVNQNRPGQQPHGQNGVRRAQTTYDKPATTDDEMARRAAASLAEKGVDVVDAYRR